MKCFKTILRCMRPMGGALDRIYLSLIGPTEPISTKVGSQIARKMPHFEYPLSTENTYLYYGMLNCKEWHPLLMKCFKTFIRYINRWEELLPCASFRYLWVSPSYVPQRLTLKSLTKCKFGGILSVWKIGCRTTRREIYSIWIDSKAVLDAEGRWEKLLAVSIKHLCVSPCNFPSRFDSHKLHIKYQIFNTLSVQKMGCCSLPGETSIGMKCSKPIFRCIKPMLWASLCIILPLMGLTDTFTTEVDSQNAHKMRYVK